MGKIIAVVLVLGFSAFAIYLTIGVVKDIRKRREIKKNKKEDKK